MPSVLLPQKKERGPADLLPIVGTVAGAVAGYKWGGGATGALTGASLGGMAGGAAKQLVDSNGGQQTQGIETSDHGQGALDRKMAQTQSDPYQQLAQARMALDNAPPDLQDHYRKPLEDALAIARRSRESANLNSGGTMA